MYTPDTLNETDTSRIYGEVCKYLSPVFEFPLKNGETQICVYFVKIFPHVI